jgi:hypothetical protein
MINALYERTGVDMFGFDNKVPDQNATAPVDPMGAPALPSEQSNPDSGYPGIPMTPDPASSSSDQGADEGTMNDDVVSPTAPQTTNDPQSGTGFSDTSTSEPIQNLPVASMPTPVTTNTNNLSHDDLLNIKQNALEQLSPLVGHLEQTPEEKFKTTMMMIQGSDDQSLVPIAYEAANAIVDEKAKAQALLDIVNEINYFTQHHQN